MNRSRPAIVAAFFTGALLISSACGLPEQDHAQLIDDLPDDLLAVTTASTTDTVAVEDDAPFELALYWHESDQGGRLIRIVRQRNTPPTLQEALQELIAGPTGEEIAATEGVDVFRPNAGLTDAELAPVITGPEGGIVTVTVQGTGFRDLPNKANAGEELVCTLTEFANVDGVIVRDARPDPIGLVGRSSESIEGAAGRANFNDCMTDEVPPDGPESPSTTAADGGG